MSLSLKLEISEADNIDDVCALLMLVKVFLNSEEHERRFLMAAKMNHNKTTRCGKYKLYLKKEET